jgi:acyl dehydratase
LLRLSRLTVTSFRGIRVDKRQFSNQFYKVADNISRFRKDVESSSSQSIIGEIIDHAVDLKNVRPGETIDLPYELTVASSMRDFWQSAFYSHDRINTSTPFARSLGFQSEVIPFGLMLFLASSMSHVDYAKLENGHSNGKYLWPVFAGDTLKKKFVILSLRPTSDGRHSIFRIHCEMKNQRGIVVFTCEKTMLFPFQVVRPSEVEVENSAAQKANKFLEHLIQKADVLQTLGSQTLTSLRAGQLIIHTLTRPLSETQCMQLSSLARLTHERHFNTRLFRKEEMFVPGGLVLGLTCSLASRDLHEVEEMSCSHNCFFFTIFHPPLLIFDYHEN